MNQLIKTIVHRLRAGVEWRFLNVTMGCLFGQSKCIKQLAMSIGRCFVFLVVNFLFGFNVYFATVDTQIKTSLWKVRLCVESLSRNQISYYISAKITGTFFHIRSYRLIITHFIQNTRNFPETYIHIRDRRKLITWLLRNSGWYAVFA